jgi:hypothetical protein
MTISALDIVSTTQKVVVPRMTVSEINFIAAATNGLFGCTTTTNLFLTDYLVFSIPRFMLIDREGLIVNSNANRPSDSALIAELEDLLKK